MRKSVVREILALSVVCLMAASVLAGCGAAASKEKKNNAKKEKEVSGENIVIPSDDAVTDFSIYEKYLDKVYSGTAKENENLKVYFCFAEKKSEGVLLIFDSKENTYLCVAGTIEEQKLEDERTAVTIVDEASDDSFAFITTYEEDEDSYTINLGEQFGTVTAKSGKRSEVLKAFEKIKKSGAESVF